MSHLWCRTGEGLSDSNDQRLLCVLITAASASDGTDVKSPEPDLMRGAAYVRFLSWTVIYDLTARLPKSLIE